jgi:hypothetical protein
MSETLADLKARYPDNSLLDPGQCAKELRKAKQTVYNQKKEGKFPCATIQAESEKGPWFVHVGEMARYLDTRIPYRLLEEQMAVNAPKKRGPKRKAHVELQAEQKFWDEVVSIMHQQDADEEAAELRATLGDFPSKPPIQI